MRIETERFNPDVEVLSFEHQDFLCNFNAGPKGLSCTDYIKNDALSNAQKGDGVTYLVFDKTESVQKLVAYYTLSTTAIPYIDRIRLDEEDRIRCDKEFDEQTYGIPAIEVKMFAVDVSYQDLFFRFEDEYMPISAWILRSIIDTVSDMMMNVVGFKAIFLHSVPDAEQFYRNNCFKNVEKNMIPLNCIDADLQAMYCALQFVHMNYEE